MIANNAGWLLFLGVGGGVNNNEKYNNYRFMVWGAMCFHLFCW